MLPHLLPTVQASSLDCIACIIFSNFHSIFRLYFDGAMRKDPYTVGMTFFVIAIWGIKILFWIKYGCRDLLIIFITRNANDIKIVIMGPIVLLTMKSR
jgi:hypothetical protein